MEGLHDQQLEPIAGKPSTASSTGYLNDRTGYDLDIRRTDRIALRVNSSELDKHVNERHASFLLASVMNVLRPRTEL